MSAPTDNRRVKTDSGTHWPVASGSALLPDEWVTLAHLGSLPHKALSPVGRDHFASLLALTRKADEHPEDHNGPCECASCMSYADEPNARGERPPPSGTVERTRHSRIAARR